MRSRAKMQSDYFTAIAQTGGNNMRPLTPEELIEDRKRKAAQALARENKKKYDDNKDNYGKKVAFNKLDLAGKIGDVSSGMLEGAQHKPYLGTIKPSPAYGFKVYSKPLLTAASNSKLIKGSGFLGHSIGFVTVGITLADEGHFGNKTKIATAKAITSAVGASTGAKIGATLGGIVGSFAPVIGTAAGAVAGGAAGAYIGGVTGGWIVDKVYE